MCCVLLVLWLQLNAPMPAAMHMPAAAPRVSHCNQPGVVVAVGGARMAQPPGVRRARGAAVHECAAAAGARPSRPGCCALLVCLQPGALQCYRPLQCKCNARVLLRLALASPPALPHITHTGIPPPALPHCTPCPQVVDGQYAFVLHTANPLTGQRGEMFGELVAGLGEVLVSGGWRLEWRP